MRAVAYYRRLDYKGTALLISCVLIVFLQGCATTSISESPQYAPINVLKLNLPPVGVANIESLMTPGQKLGGYHDGLLRINWQPYVAQGVLKDEKVRMFQKRMIDELKDAGYRLVGRDTLFGEGESLEARFLFGGQITGGTLNTYDVLAGNYSSSTDKIKWQVYDKIGKAVIYQHTTEGSGKAKGLDAESAVNLSFRNSFRGFLSDGKLVEALEAAAKKK